MSEQKSSVKSVTITPDLAGQRLDLALVHALPEFSRTRIKSLILSGHARLLGNGPTLTEPSMRVKPGQTVALTIPPVADSIPQAQARELDITYEDRHLIVLDKPAGLVVHPAPGNPDHTLVNALLAHCGDSLSGIGGVRRPGIVHRLDKDTSGLLVVAKTDQAHHHLSAQFAQHSVARAYLSVVWGMPLKARGTITGNIGRNPRNRKKMAIVTRGGKPATTHFTTIRRIGAFASLLECRLETGRTHQIRVHLTAHGHAIIGDPLYGRARAPGSTRAFQDALRDFKRQALHARSLGFIHPETGKFLKFSSPLPNDIQDLIKKIESL